MIEVLREENALLKAHISEYEVVINEKEAVINEKPEEGKDQKMLENIARKKGE